MESNPAILFVRIETALTAAEAERRIRERQPMFREVPGLVQKIFARDAASGDICGIYFFRDRAALTAYRESALAQSIPEAYEAINVRREVYESICSVFAEKGPLDI